MRVLVVDDEAPARARLKRLLAAMPDVTVVGKDEDGEQAVARITEHAPQLVLLDVRMPRLNGFALVQAMGSEMPLTIFCTAHGEYALQAFEARAIDYLLKPVQPERLDAALDRARLHLQRPVADRKRGLRSVSDLVETEAPYLPRLLVHDGLRAHLLPVERIDRIRADRNHAEVHSGAQNFRVRRTLTSLATRLDPTFFLRISKSDIVRLDAVREIHPWSHGDYRVVMHDGATLSWSRRFRADAE